jgi:hypothetical protein
MKAKRIGLIAVIAFGIMCVLTMNAGAQSAWYTCSVVSVGPTAWGTYICLTDTSSSPAFTNRWFQFPPNHAKEMLAVALTAMSNSMNVTIYSDPEEYFPYLYVIYLNQ